MKKKSFKRGTSMLLALLMCFSTIFGLGTTAFAAGEQAEVYMIGFPRDGDANYGGEWGHPNLNYMNGWTSGKSNYTNIRAMNSYEGNICYCIEPGVPQDTGDTFTNWDENFWDNYPSELNSTISPDEIKTFIGRILQYGYTGPISLNWRSQNEGGDKLAYAVATQLLIWETVIGERNSDFGKVDTGSYDAVTDSVSANHPLYSQIMSYYNSIASSVKTHATLPSFLAKSTGKAQEIEMEWNGSEYIATLTDSNGVLGNYSFTANVTGIEFSVSGNTLTITADEAPTDTVTITASKKNSQRMGVITWTDGVNAPGSGIQDVVTYAQSVTDPVKGYIKLEVSLGSAKIVKTSEDGEVEGITFTITGNGINETIKTGSNGEFQIDNLTPGIYTVTEQTYDKYEPQEVRRVTVVSGQVATVTFNNVLKRGDLAVYKNSEDGLNEGITFHLYGTSLSGHAVDEYAMTDSDGIAYFGDVLIGSGYVLEEVDTAIRYVVPDDQSAAIEWNTVTNKSFANVLKKWNATVTKSDVQTGTAQGDASLAGAVYGVYKGDQLMDTYTTDANGQFTTNYYVCGDDWSIREITPSEGYLLDKGGIYFGENAISHNLIICNRENLMNQSTFILGVPGSGKSFSAKELIFFLLLNTDDDILICDPEGEYASMLESMKQIASIIRVSAGGHDRLNAMYMVDGYGENNPIVVKSQFIMSLVEQIDRKGVGPQQKSIIDRCTAAVYREAEQSGMVPTLNTLRQKLLEQPEPEAKKIALSLELYTTGSLDIFGHSSNVDLDKRVVVFDIHGLGTQLKPAGLLVITDTMLNRVTLNWKRGKRTHVFIDEFHVVFENEFSAEFFNSAWRQFRKRNAYPTAITQNVEYLLDSVQASTMLSNSEFIIMLNQAASDREKLAKLLNISHEQMSYITNADSGCGLIKYGGALVPFINRFPKDTKLYQLMTTRPGEGLFSAGQA